VQGKTTVDIKKHTLSIVIVLCILTQFRNKIKGSCWKQQ